MIEPNHREEALLTSKSVNQLAGTILRNEGTTEQVKLLKLDWRAFIEQEFRLTNTQTKNISKIPAGEVAKIQDALNRAVEQGGTLELKLASESQVLEADSDSMGGLTIMPETGLNLEIGPIPIFHCHFDAYCGNWDCDWGPDFSA